MAQSWQALLWHDMAWSMFRNVTPQVQLELRLVMFHPYRRHKASLKAPLLKVNLCSSMGKVDNHEDTPFSLAQSINLHLATGNWW